MTARPQMAVILSTYQRPAHLRRSLLSLSMQCGVEGHFEVIVTDDGSLDDTEHVVRRFASEVDFPVSFTTHEHGGFHLARCRNEGLLASSAPYVLFSDGDCLFPPDHLRQHLRRRRANVAWSGDSLHLDEQATARVDESAIVEATFPAWVSRGERQRIGRRWVKDQVYQAIRHRKRPKLTGSNIAVWRSDLERINGFDECFRGWGCEDDDLADRLRMSGVRIASMLGFTRVYHMWHPTAASEPTRWRDGPNVPYLLRRDKPARCETGLTARQRAGQARLCRWNAGTELTTLRCAVA